MARGKSIIQTDKKCFVCGSRTVHLHHTLYGTANRKKSDEWGCWCYLCPNHHTGKEGVHNGNKVLDTYLKQYTQRKFEELYGHDQFIKVFRKNYL